MTTPLPEVSTPPNKSKRKLVLWLVIGIALFAFLACGLLSLFGGLALITSRVISGTSSAPVHGIEVVLQAQTSDGSTPSEEETQQAVQILKERAQAFGVAKVGITAGGPGEITIRMAKTQGEDDLVERLTRVGQLAFVPFGKAPLPEGTRIEVDYSNPVDPTAPVTGPETSSSDGTTPIYRPLITGSGFQTVNVSLNQLDQPVVNFTLNTYATRKFADFTASHVGEYLGIVQDGAVISSPLINAAITRGQGIIEGNFTPESANALAIQLRYGTLPFPLKVVSQKEY